MKSRVALAMLLVFGITLIGPGPASAVPETEIDIDKTVTAKYYKPGDTITFKYVVTGNDQFDGIVVSDDKCSPVTPVLDGDGYNVGDLYGTKGVFNGLAGDAWEYTCQATAPADPGAGAKRTNIATVSGTSAGLPFTDTDSLTLQSAVLRKLVALYLRFPPDVILAP
ncbi:MAG: hypothetical protein R6W48_03940, partial [Gaiellaceae bacterium]